MRIKTEPEIINLSPDALKLLEEVAEELELRIIRDRVRSGMANARAKERKIRRPQITADDIPASFLRHYPAYMAGKMNLSELARISNLSRTTAYKYIGLLEK